MIKEIRKSTLVPHSAVQMRDLVEDVERYSQFLPWCSDARILSNENGLTRASLHIRYHGLNTAFTTENERLEDCAIDMKLVEGPFRMLHGKWRFVALDEMACRVEFQLQYEFSSTTLSLIAGPVFHKIADTLVDAFVHRAGSVYGAGK
jgi:ribosome-associated toxin RatA of RatAB toxin-antitoxin module